MGSSCLFASPDCLPLAAESPCAGSGLNLGIFATKIQKITISRKAGKVDSVSNHAPNQMYESFTS